MWLLFERGPARVPHLLIGPLQALAHGVDACVIASCRQRIHSLFRQVTIEIGCQILPHVVLAWRLPQNVQPLREQAALYHLQHHPNHISAPRRLHQV